jgi:hypothetical protein
MFRGYYCLWIDRNISIIYEASEKSEAFLFAPVVKLVKAPDLGSGDMKVRVLPGVLTIRDVTGKRVRLKI